MYFKEIVNICIDVSRAIGLVSSIFYTVRHRGKYIEESVKFWAFSLQSINLDVIENIHEFIVTGAMITTGI